MRKRNWFILIGVSLVIYSVVLYLLHWVIFKDPRHIFIYMLGDIAFLGIEVLIVTLIVHQVLRKRDKRMMMEKLNMVIGTFFSEVGTELLKSFCSFDPGGENKKGVLRKTGEWEDDEFLNAKRDLSNYPFSVDVSMGDLSGMKELLIGERDFLVRLLENPNLLEHESFTDLMWAVFHLTEELDSRGDLALLPDSDLKHLEGDMERAYERLTGEWLEYMLHLKGNYPYLFSLAMRLNPFDPLASVEVR